MKYETRLDWPIVNMSSIFLLLVWIFYLAVSFSHKNLQLFLKLIQHLFVVVPIFTWPYLSNHRSYLLGSASQLVEFQAMVEYNESRLDDLVLRVFALQRVLCPVDLH